MTTYTLYFKAKNNESCNEEFTVCDRMSGLTTDEVKVLYLHLVKKFKEAGMCLVYHCRTLCDFKACSSSYEIEVVAVPYQNAHAE